MYIKSAKATKSKDEKLIKKILKEDEKQSKKVSQEEEPQNNETPNLFYINYVDALSCFILCLKYEVEWEIYHLLFQETPKILRNKSLILTTIRDARNEGESEDIEIFSQLICDMISTTSPKAFESFRAKKEGYVADFHCNIFPVLTCLPSYHHYLNRNILVSYIIVYLHRNNCCVLFSNNLFNVLTWVWYLNALVSVFGLYLFLLSKCLTF